MTGSDRKDNDQTDQAQGPDAFVTEAYNLKDQQSMQAFYAKWADKYDAQMAGLKYLSPGHIADLLMAALQSSDSKILDIGCGTGLTSRSLFDAGYRELYGIDLSEDMVRVAESRGIYRSLTAGDVNLPLPYDDDYFDGVISSGTFTHGHVGPEPFDEICRILRPGGVIACTIHDHLFESRGFKARLDELESQNVLQCLSLTMDRYFADEDPEGWFCVYRKR